VLGALSGFFGGVVGNQGGLRPNRTRTRASEVRAKPGCHERREEAADAEADDGSCRTGDKRHQCDEANEPQGHASSIPCVCLKGLSI
jgi:hypothetical protein